MPVAYTLYSLWAGLQVGPLEDVFHCARVLVLVLEMLKMKLRITQEVPILAMASQALRWLPAFSRMLLHRLLIFALSFYLDYGYSFAGQMMILDPDRCAYELANSEQWTLNSHLSFHLGGMSLDLVKEHKLLSYVESIFAVQAARVTEMHVKATVSLNGHAKELSKLEELPKRQASGLIRARSVDKHLQRKASAPNRKPPQRNKRAIVAFKSKVACVIFTRRLTEALPNTFEAKKKRKNGKSLWRLALYGVSRLSKLVQRCDKLFLVSSVICAGIEVHKQLRLGKC
jgi:hypothetical protein